MAYKFSLGTYRHSGSMVAEEGITVDSGGLTVTTGSVSLPAGEINTAELADAAVTAIKLAADAVETAKIKDLAVTNDKLAGNIASSKLAELNAFDTADLAEGTNLYFTQTRARQALSIVDAGGDGAFTYDSGSGVFTYTGPSASEVRAHLSAGDGLAYSGGQFAVTASIAGAGLAWNAGVLSVDTAEIAAGLSGSVRDIVADFVEGSDFVTFDDSTGTIGVSAAAFSGSADAAFDARLATKSTTNLAEGSNLYFTQARARQALSIVDAGGDGSFSYDSGSGVFTYTGPSASEVRAHLNATDGINYNASTGMFSLTSSVAGAGLGLAAGVLDVLATGAIAVKNDRVALSSSVAGDGLGFIASGLGDVSQLKVNVDASSIEINADALRVKALGITNAMLSGGIENAKLVNSSVTVDAGAGLTTGGSVSLGGSVTLAVASANGGIVVNADDIELKLATTGALNIGASGLDLKTIISGERTFSDKVTINGDLVVLGSTFSASVGTLLIEDSNIVVGDGSTSFATDYGMTFGNGWATLQTAQANIDGVAGVENLLSSSLALKAPAVAANTFYGALVGTTQESIQLASGSATAEQAVVLCDASGGAFTLTLPAASDWSGKFIKVKKSEGSANGVTVDGNASETIDGVASIVLESPYAAVMLVSNGSNWFVF